ncbi:aryl hydrocarbon receptor-like isoform X2 [Aquila chrysaetos chrysaetos]|uniref:aryl hydrocarbon receptor-like isoform X2 n=1 Tax=Aquila chrysaetos chrysaetos TaxID=223781 RepID=UPI001177078B|nr:aryl hydrocarbon receptor-like isoform X2 [Aquila chrysaetos chrysaetos]
MYAGRKRRKPVPRAVRPGPAEGGTSNPSKRHRERLNWELERLAGLLPFPEEVVAGLDKLSVLRLSAGYLRAKSFFSVALKNHGAKEAERDEDCDNGPAMDSAAVPEGELLLQALNGFVLVVTSEGLIFYSSHTIQDYLGFHQTDVMHQSVFELIHTEDQQEFRRNLHWALNPPHAPEGEPSPEVGKSLSSSAVAYKPDQLPPENSSFLERSFVCRFRCLLDNSSGFLALNLQGRLKFLHGQNKRSEDGSALPPQLALFAISTPLQPPSILQIRTKNMIFRTKHKLDFTPLACDAKGKIVLGYTEAELRMCGTGYQFVHAADMLYCAENHVRMMKTGESGLTVFRLLTKENRWKWVQANARLVYKNGKPEYIIVTQRPLVDEEGGEHLRKRSMHLPFTFATGEALLYQSAYPLPGFPDPFQSKGKTSKSKKISHSHGVRSQKNGIDPSSLLGAVMRQDKAVYASHPAPAPNHSFSSSFVDQLKDVSLLDAGRDAWSMGAAPVSSRGDQLKEELVDLQQEDPLLATLDSLSIKSDERCSNNELFSALEGLGLNAEDLELLLLDEKMVMVNMDPDHNQFLNNCLTSNKILSYIHTTLVNKHEGGQQVCPLPGTSPSPCGDTTTCQDPADYEDSQYLPQHVVQPSVAPGQLPAPLWEQPLHAVLGQPTLLLPEPAKEEELSDGSQWRPAGEEGLLRFLQPARGTPWDKAPSLPPGAPCPQVPPRARQLEGDFPAMHPTQEDAHLSFSLPSQCQGCVGPPSQLKHRHLLVNGLCGHSPDSAPHVLPSSSSSPWQDYVSPLLGSPAQPGFYSISQDLISQHQGCLGPGPGTPTVHFNLNGFCSMETVGSGGSQEEMAPYPSFFPPSSYQLIPEKQLSPVPSMPQHPFPSSAAGCFGSIGSPLETPYGTYTSALSQESRHRPESSCVLPSSPMGLSGDHPMLGGSLAPPCQPHPRAEALPDHPHASSGDFCL